MTSEALPSQCRRSLPSERRQWERIFGALREMLQRDQESIKTLIGDRNLLQNYVLTQRTVSESKIHVLESRIAKVSSEKYLNLLIQCSQSSMPKLMQMKKVLDLTKNASEAKLDFVVGVKQTEISRCKEQFGKFRISLFSKILLFYLSLFRPPPPPPPTPPEGNLLTTLVEIPIEFCFSSFPWRIISFYLCLFISRLTP